MKRNVLSVCRSWKPGLTMAVLIASAGSFTSVAAEPKLDVSKLKSGDKLEYNVRGDEWVTVEFVGKGPSSATVMTKRPPFPNPVSTSISRLRMPAIPAAKGEGAGGAKSAGVGKDNPFATEEERQAGAKPRTWSDRTGSFKIEATLVRVEDGKVVLHRTDTGAEIAVPLDKLSDADQKFIAGWQAEARKNDAADSSQASRGTAKSDSPAAESKSATKEEIAVTPTDFKSVAERKVDSSIGWAYTPDPLSEELKGRDLQIKLQPPIDFFEEPVRVLPLSKDKKAFVVMLTSRPGKDEPVSRVQACNLDSGKVDAVAVFGHGVEPLEMSTDGTLILARSAGFLPETHGELRVYSREGNRVKPICAWRPFDTAAIDDAGKKGSTARPGYETGIWWSALVDNTHVFTLSEVGELVLWQFPDVKPVYRMSLARLTQPVMSAGRKLIVVPYGGGIAILSALDGAPVGALTVTENSMARAISAVKSLPDVARSVSFLASDVSNGALALRADGQRLAFARGNRIRVWDLNAQELVRDFLVQGMNVLNASRLDWTNDNHLLIHGQYLVDVERRIPIWKSAEPAKAYVVRGDRVWFTETSRDRRENRLVSAALPDKALLEAAAKINPNDLLVLRPGIEVAIDMQAGGAPGEIEEARKVLEAKLVENGMKVSPDAATRLVASIQPGKTVAVHYRRFGGGAEEQQVPTQVLSLSFQVGGETVWKEERSSSPPLSLMLKESESLEQAIEREMQGRNEAVGVKALGAIPLPAYLSRMPKFDEQK